MGGRLIFSCGISSFYYIHILIHEHIFNFYNFPRIFQLAEGENECAEGVGVAVCLCNQIHFNVSARTARRFSLADENLFMRSHVHWSLVRSFVPI